MDRRHFFRAGLLRAAGACLFAAAAVPALAADAANTVETPGSATLTMCRSWIFFSSCENYNHIAIPARVKLGDRLDLVFGSNTKKIGFPVGRITRDGDRCTIYNDPAGGTEKVNKVEVDPCRPVSP